MRKTEVQKLNPVFSKMVTILCFFLQALCGWLPQQRQIPKQPVETAAGQHIRFYGNRLSRSWASEVWPTQKQWPALRLLVTNNLPKDHSARKRKSSLPTSRHTVQIPALASFPLERMQTERSCSQIQLSSGKKKFKYKPNQQFHHSLKCQAFKMKHHGRI